MVLFVLLYFCLNFSQTKEREILLFVKKNGINKEPSRLAACVNSSLHREASILGKGVHEQCW